ncbi:MAG: hypothetical protein B7Z55_04080 [Planctomycetales bacterium 12-60-4]|nr:MAG: hypothetical protein B7Z55_04080 [Planctomycetales bacterium 12-60-4]
MNPLHDIGDALRSLFLAIPLSAVRVAFVAIPLILMVWVLRLPSSETVPAGREHRWDEDLRAWAWVALALQVLIYCVL